MAYLLKNIHTGTVYTCDDHVWLASLDCARSHGWDERGTTIDFVSELEDAWDEKIEYAVNLLRLFQLHMFRLEWNGNYREKENQVVSDDDAAGLMDALTGYTQDRDLLDFLSKGSFKISVSE